MKVIESGDDVDEKGNIFYDFKTKKRNRNIQ